MKEEETRYELLLGHRIANYYLDNKYIDSINVLEYHTHVVFEFYFKKLKIHQYDITKINIYSRHIRIKNTQNLQ